MTRPLLVGSYLQVTRDGLSANEKEEKMHGVIIIVHCSIVIVVNQRNHVMHYFDPFSSFSR